MRIGIIRHAKVIHRHPFFSTGKIFDLSCADYNTAIVAPVSLKISKEDFPVCCVSSMKRAIDTATAIYEGSFQTSPELIEVPNCAIWLMKMRLPTFLRSVIARTSWFFNYSKIPETRTQSSARARKFLTHLLEEKQQDTLLVTHGFFMQSLRHELHRMGFKGKCPYNPSHVTLYVFERK